MIYYMGKRKPIVGSVAELFDKHSSTKLGSDADVLVGGAGDDRLTGGDGSDIFIFEPKSDRITDFAVDEGDPVDLRHAPPSTVELFGMKREQVRLLLTGDEPRVVAPSFDQGPPRLAEFFVALFLSKKKRDAVLGDLEERFDKNCEDFGLRRARVRYWAEALNSLGPLFWSAFKKLGFGALLFAWLRRG